MPKPLAIIYSDLHLNIWPKFNENNTRLRNGIDVLDVISDKAEQLQVPKIFLGDLLHKEDYLSNDLLDILLPSLSRVFSKENYSQPTFAITGNHDQSKHNSFFKPSPSYIKTFGETFDNLTCVDNKTFIIDNGSGSFYFHGIPYITNDVGLVDEIRNIGMKFKKKKNILLLHTTLPTARDTDERTIHSNFEENEFLKATKNFKLVLSGHIHKPEMIIKDFMYSVGAPQQQRATDRNCDMGYWVLYDNLKMDFIWLDQYPRFKYFKDPKEIKDDGNFWIRKTKAKKKTKETELDINKDINNNNLSKVAKKYCKFKGIDDKKKIKALERTLKKVL